MEPDPDLPHPGGMELPQADAGMTGRLPEGRRDLKEDLEGGPPGLLVQDGQVLLEALREDESHSLGPNFSRR